LIKFLQREHPQTVAVVLSHLPPHQSADVITSLPPMLQAQVLKRLAYLEQTDPTIVREIEAEMESLLADQVYATRNRSAGWKAVESILQSAETIDRRDILKNLAICDPELAGQFGASVVPGRPPAEAIPPDDQPHHVPNRSPRPASNSAPRRQDRLSPPDSGNKQLPKTTTGSMPGPVPAAADRAFSFSELETLDDGSWAVVLKTSGPELMLLALTGAPVELVDRLLGKLPARQARELQRRMESIGPIRLQDIEIAQSQVAAIASELARQGKIQLFGRQQLAVAV
jgi:flagellar motor switch protein FliG